MNQVSLQSGTAPKVLLGEMLCARGLVSSEDVEKALKIQSSVGGRLGTLLVRIGAVSEDQLLQVLAEQLQVVYLRNSNELPDNLLVFQFMSLSPIKLDWFIDHSVLLWQGDEELCCLARDMQDHGLTEILNYFYPQQAVTFYIAANHQLDKLLEFVRRERAIEQLFSSIGSIKRI